MLPVAPIGILSSVAGSYIIEGSAYPDGSSGYLSFTPSSTGNTKTFVIEQIVKIVEPSSGSHKDVLWAGRSANPYLRCETNDSTPASLWFAQYNGSSYDFQMRTNQLFRDVSAYYHLVWAFDTTQATSADRVRLWVNGTEVTSWQTSNYPSQNTNLYWNNSSYAMRLGNDFGSQYSSLYVARATNYDGLSITDPETDGFGETTTDGYWRINDVSGLTFGTNGFLLEGGTDISNGYKTGASTAAISSEASTAAHWSASSNFTFASDGVARNTTNDAARTYYAFTGDFTITATFTDGDTSARFGVYDATEDGTFAATGSDHGGLASMTNSWYCDWGNGNFYYGSASQAAESIAEGSVITIERTGSTIKITDDGVDAHTFSQTFSGPVRLVIAGGGAAQDWDSISFTADGVKEYAAFVNGTITATNDSPTDDATNGYGNFATINANQPNDGTFSNGNLTLLQSGGSTRTYLSTIKLPSTGKWRFKYTVDSGAGGGGRSVGILDFSTQSLNALLTGLANNWVYDGATGNKYINGSGSAYGSTWTTGDSVEVLYDADAGTVEFYKNTTSQGTISSVSGDNLFFAMGAENGMTFTVDFGQNGYTTNDSSFSPLATQNITPPAVVPSDHAEILLYEGTGGTQDITGQDWGGNDELLVLKNRDQADSWKWMDTIRGAGQSIQSNNVDAESDESASHTAFNDDGFSLAGTDGSFNTSSESYMALRLRAGISGSNSDGSITSTVSANTTSGFSIVKWTGNATAGATVGHGLGVPPSMIIVKNLDGTNQWTIYHKTLGNAQQIEFRTNAKQASTAWNSTDPGNDVFTIGSGSDVNGSGNNYIAYCFTDVADLATSIFRIGSWAGNSSTNGPMNTQDASTKFLLWKQSTGANSWYVLNNAVNTYNPTQNALVPNTTAAETTSLTQMDFLSNGFKCRSSDGLMNATGSTYIYLGIIADDGFLAGGSDAWTQGRAR